jgi:hypothetical protein
MVRKQARRRNRELKTMPDIQMLVAAVIYWLLLSSPGLTGRPSKHRRQRLLGHPVKPGDDDFLCWKANLSVLPETVVARLDRAIQ